MKPDDVAGDDPGHKRHLSPCKSARPVFGAGMSSFLWLNGRLCTLDEARLSPFDHGFLVGDGVFETLVARGGRIFAAAEHYQRLCRSCAAMGLTPLPEAEYLEAMAAVLQVNGLSEARVRVTLSSGDGPLASDRGSVRGTVVVVATALNVWPPVERVCLVPWPRNEKGALAQVKSVSYGENVVALAHAKAQGYGEALLANTRGELCEGTGSNVFVILQGRLCTPPLSAGCLAGVTRLLVMQACAEAGIECEERSLPVDVLDHCEEAFLTSTTRDVHPIAAIGSRQLVAPGPVTQRVSEAFNQLRERMLKGA